ncbi:acyl-CoA dehydrogenase family protein [Haloglomus litoreum]|uniref:acyl-CoA dehydrogenase family protein n=1 Tax=Haloglomus litoreum TaxID=3034026 RepID=UPI0023E83A8D|nr:acyl-CoA dehydrogenase [Haloglomus sp. DT116]
MVTLTDEQRMLVDVLDDIARDEFAADAFTHDGFPWENVRTLAEHDLWAVNLGEEWGGGGLSEFAAVLAIETVGAVCPETANAIYGQTMVAPRAIEMFGSETLKERYLPPVCAGESAIAIGISEPAAGSDAGAMATAVRETDDGLVLSGEKIWLSYVPASDAAVVWARFPDDTLGTVLVDLDTPGVDVHEHYTNMAGHTQSHLFFEDVPVPEEQVLVRGKQALKEQLKALNWERVGSAAYATSMARCALEHAIDYAGDREQFGQPIGEFQGLRWEVADAVKEYTASRALTHDAATNTHGEGDTPAHPDRLRASIAKFHASETAERVVSDCLQVFGATGYQQGHPLEFLYRLARGRRIAAGTDEIMRENIADEVFDGGGLPSLG